MLIILRAYRLFRRGHVTQMQHAPKSNCILNVLVMLLLGMLKVCISSKEAFYTCILVVCLWCMGVACRPRRVYKPTLRLVHGTGSSIAFTRYTFLVRITVCIYTGQYILAASAGEIR